MGDLDSNGNVDYSNMPAYSVRGDKTNATDLRRSVGNFADVYEVSGAV